MMRPSSQSFLSRAAILGVIIVVSSGCVTGRNVQCRNFGSATKEIMDHVMTVHQNHVGRYAYDSDFEINMAMAWDSGVVVINAVELSDNELKTIRDDLAAAYQQAAASHRQAAALIPSGSILSVEVEQQVDALQLEAEAGIPPAINELNLYCIGS